MMKMSLEHTVTPINGLYMAIKITIHRKLGAECNSKAPIPTDFRFNSNQKTSNFYCFYAYENLDLKSKRLLTQMVIV